MSRQAHTPTRQIPCIFSVHNLPAKTEHDSNATRDSARAAIGLEGHRGISEIATLVIPNKARPHCCAAIKGVFTARFPGIAALLEGLPDESVVMTRETVF